VGYNGNCFVIYAPSVSADTVGMSQDNHIEPTSVNSPASAESHQIQQPSSVQVVEDHRKPLGPIGTERASRRPPATASHHSEFSFSNELPAWDLTGGGGT
jgi:hypothetical protein